MAAPTDAQIADAKAKGMVWCNSSSKVYHTSTDKYFDKTKKGQFLTEADAKAALTRYNPQGRLIAPNEVAEAVAFLCRDAALAMTGQSIVVAGGEVT